MPNKPSTWFTRLFLNNKATIYLLNISLGLVVIWMATKLTWLLDPLGQFLSTVAPPLILAGILYYLMVPLVNLLERRWHINRGLTIAGLFVVLVLLISLGMRQFIPAVQQQISGFVKAAPQYWRELTKISRNVADQQHWPDFIDMNQVGQDLTKFFGGKNGNLVDGTFSQLSSIINVVGNVVITIATAPFLLFFMLKDGQHFPQALAKLLPERYQATLLDLLNEINTKVGQYIQGQLTVAFFVSIIFMIGYSVIGLKFALVLGLLAGPLNLIPYLGSALAMIPALVLGALTSIQMFIAVIVVFLIEWLLETQVISPLVMGSNMAMHPVTIAIVLLTAGKLFGLVGVILGIPGYAVLKIIISRLFNWYRSRSGWYHPERNDEP
ncbi:AI-2E family transporter [Loigolactobacillus zhaoyuanensis]|uniref:AI-2E family transporter n=1 Tax=Loigolactobacillus zhaoyuanensis TaxID=2486017 RepID=A0ABW8UC03_9LACO